MGGGDGLSQLLPSDTVVTHMQEVGMAVKEAGQPIMVQA